MIQQLQQPKLRDPFFPGRRQALVVQQDVSLGDIAYLVSAVFVERSYGLSQIGPEACTKERVMASIDELVGGSDDDSRTIFYYMGHGFDNNGVPPTIVGPYSSGIEPSELFGELGRVKGQKAVFIDACLSGRFTEYPNNLAVPVIRDYVVFASTRADGLSISSASWNVPNGSFLKEKVISNLAHWLWTTHCEYGIVFLDSWSIPKYGVQDLQKLAKNFPALDIVGRVNLEIQRVSDTRFEL